MGTFLLYYVVDKSEIIQLEVIVAPSYTDAYIDFLLKYPDNYEIIDWGVGGRI